MALALALSVLATDGAAAEAVLVRAHHDVWVAFLLPDAAVELAFLHPVLDVVGRVGEAVPDADFVALAAVARLHFTALCVFADGEAGGDPAVR